jgi:nucleoside-diphosphate-sugar epimerase
MRGFNYANNLVGSVNLINQVVKVFNIGADRPFDLNTLAQAVAAEMGVPPKIDYLPARKESRSAATSSA